MTDDCPTRRPVVGYHDRPLISPGAWLRPGPSYKVDNGRGVKASLLQLGHAWPPPWGWLTRCAPSAGWWGEAMLHGPDHGLCSMVHADLAVGTPDIGLH